jgi:hypothetical protein
VDQSYDSALIFTCSAGFADTVTYTCGQDGTFKTADTCIGNNHLPML